MTKPTTPARKGTATPAATAGQMNSATSPPVAVQPPDGWTVQSDYGTLRTRNIVDLVRLEDVHTWLMANGFPADVATQKIFGPFYEACLRLNDGGEAEPLIDALQIANARTYPECLFKANKPSQGDAPQHWASAFPDLGHVRFSDGPGVLIYAMAEGALRVWHGGANINTDHLAARKDRQDRADDATYSIQWPEDGDLRLLLGRLAAPIQTAHALWGYGTAQAVQEAMDSEQPKPPYDWKAPGAKQFLRDEVDEYDRLHGRGGKAAAARRYGFGPSRVTALLKEYEAELEAAKPPPAHYATGLGARNGCKAA